MASDQFRPRKQAGSPDGGQFAAKQHADAAIAPLGTPTQGRLDPAHIAPGSTAPRNELEREMLRADARVARAKDQAAALHRAALVDRLSEAVPDVAHVGLDYDDATGTVKVAYLGDAAGDEIADPQLVEQVDKAFRSENEHISTWREDAEFGASSMTSSGPAAISAVDELENAPLVPEAGTRDAAILRAGGVVENYRADYGGDIDPPIAARDMVTDLYHWAEDNEIDFDELVRSAVDFAEEQARSWDAAA